MNNGVFGTPLYFCIFISFMTFTPLDKQKAWSRLDATATNSYRYLARVVSQGLVRRGLRRFLSGLFVSFCLNIARYEEKRRNVSFFIDLSLVVSYNVTKYECLQDAWAKCLANCQVEMPAFTTFLK